MLSLDKDIAIDLSNVSKTYHLYNRNALDRFLDTFIPGIGKRFKSFDALKDVSLTVKKGEILGLVGQNGAGKSTMLKLISGITQPTTGCVEVQGKIIPLLELGGGFNPEYTGRENIYFYCSLQGMRKEDVDKLVPEIIEFSELEEFIDEPVKKYSSGMRARLSFSVSVNIDPDILILDEVLAVGDELFKRKCYDRMNTFFKSGKTIIYVSHSAQSVIDLCTRAVLIHHGELISSDSPTKIIRQYRKLSSLKSNKTLEEEYINRLKYPPIEKEEKEQAENKEKKSRVELLKDLPTAPKLLNESFFLPDFISKAQRLAKKKNIDFIEYRITNNNDISVNHLIFGEDYTLEFSAVFYENVPSVSLACMIYDIKGKDVSGAMASNANYTISDLKKGQRISFNGKFSCNLRPGIYGIRLVVKSPTTSAKDNVCTLYDAIIFRVLEKTITTGIGRVRLFNEIEVEKYNDSI